MSLMTYTPATGGGHVAGGNCPSSAAPHDEDLILQTSDGHKFPVHKAILTLSSSSGVAILGRMHVDPRLDDKGRPTLRVTEDSRTLRMLLSLLWPPLVDNLPFTTDVTVAFAVREAARKYQMHHAISTVEKVIVELANKHPVPVYVNATRLQWEEGARAAAKAYLGYPSNIQAHSAYYTELGSLQYSDIYKLLAYHTDCANRVLACMQDLKWMSSTAHEDHWRPCWTTCSKKACKGPGHKKPEWFRNYLSTVARALQTSPSAKTLDNPELVATALAQASQRCSYCRGGAWVDLHQFNTRLAKKVESVIDEVRSVLFSICILLNIFLQTPFRNDH